jgi:AcrR family transcriptional regulator
MTPAGRREHLVAVALRLYGERSPEHVSVDDVTRAADVSRALFYRYFTSLDALRVAALGVVAAELVEQVTLPAGGPLDERLRAALAAFLDVAERHAPAYVALLRSGPTTGSAIGSSATDALVDGVRAHMVGLLAEHVPTAGRPLVAMTLRGWVGLVEGACLAWLQDRAVPRWALVAWLADQLTAMLDAAARASVPDVAAGRPP